jgi:hypothetical protein
VRAHWEEKRGSLGVDDVPSGSERGLAQDAETTCDDADSSSSSEEASEAFEDSSSCAMRAEDTLVTSAYAAAVCGSAQRASTRSAELGAVSARDGVGPDETKPAQSSRTGARTATSERRGDTQVHRAST